MVVVGLGLSANVTGSETPAVASSDLNPSLQAAAESALGDAIPTHTPDHLRPAPIDGFVEARYGTEIVYVDPDRGYLINGDIIDLDGNTNLTDQAKAEARKEALSTVSREDLVVFTPDGSTTATINVFTDPNCPYCQQLHEEMDVYLDAGVEVRYLMFPVLGRNSPEVMDRIWCASDRTGAMDRAKSGDPLDDLRADCATPQESHLALGQSLGVRGTPAIFTEDGQNYAGYRPAAEVIEALRSN
ncbi:DsbC family protein [Thioalkalivibrio sp. ALE16]|uniref:DsbC family protein n=1 Tax=Thioalkalivibrio sp. ALE16 TaxID=1158172 RepID=UPI0012DC7965